MTQIVADYRKCETQMAADICGHPRLSIRGNPRPPMFFIRAQSMVEYAAVIAIVAAALVSMAIYVKRGISGKVREAADSVGEQYHPTRTASNITYVVNSKTTSTSKLLVDQNLNGTIANVMESDAVVDENSDRSGREDVGAMGGSIWE